MKLATLPRIERPRLPNRSRAQAWCKFCGAQLPKVLRTCSVVPFFRRNRSGAKAWCKFNEVQLQKVLRHRQFFTILTSKSLSRAGVVQILSPSWAADPPQLLFFGADFASLRSHETLEKHRISRNSYPPKSLASRTCAVKRLCCQTSILQDRAATFSIVGS